MRNIIREFCFTLLQNYVSVVLCLLFLVAVYWNFRKGEEINRLCELTGSHLVSADYPQTKREELDTICVAKKHDRGNPEDR
jgi:hypothetical protein